MTGWCRTRWLARHPRRWVFGVAGEPATFWARGREPRWLPVLTAVPPAAAPLWGLQKLAAVAKIVSEARTVLGAAKDDASDGDAGDASANAGSAGAGARTGSKGSGASSCAQPDESHLAADGIMHKQE